MISKNTISFLKELKNNNSKEWFDNNRERYQEARKDFINQMNNLIEIVQQIDPFVGQVEAKNTIFRINRDIRFSKDKNPYKTNFGGVIAKGGTRKSPYGCYYFHLEPTMSFIGGGIYMPEPKILKTVRDDIYGRPEEFKKIIKNKEFKNLYGELWGDKLIRPPKGFPSDFSEIDLLKHKHYTVIHDISDDIILTNNFEEYASKLFKTLLPFNNFLNRAIDFILNE